VKLKAIRAHLVDGRAVKVGEIYETSDALGGSLIVWGKAIPAPGVPAPKAKRAPMTPETAAALVPGAGDN
jgi:hypothetical protein